MVLFMQEYALAHAQAGPMTECVRDQSSIANHAISSSGEGGIQLWRLLMVTRA